MILIYYVVFSLLVSSVVSVARSHRIMNILTVMNAAGAMITAIIAFQGNLPLTYLENKDLLIDHLAAYEILIAGTVFLLAAVYLKGYIKGMIQHQELDKRDMQVFYIAYNILMLLTVLVFSSNNLALFWIFAELTTFVSALLIAILNSTKNIDASLKYIFVTSIAMLFSFIGIILFFALTQHTLAAGTLNLSDITAHAKEFPPTLLAAAAVFVFIGFAAKSGIAPFHTWLPHAHSRAPSAISAVLSAVLLNIGVYGILRLTAIVRQTPAIIPFTKILLFFGMLSIFIAAFSMLTQRNLKKLIAFSSIEHMGIMLVGIGIGTPIALFWVLYHVLAHALTKALLFFSAGILHQQYQSNRVEKMENALKLQPLASLGMMLGSAAIAGMPPFMIFMSKLSILLQAGNASTGLLLILLILLVAAASSFALVLTKMFSQIEEKNVASSKKYQVHIGMEMPIVALLILIFVLGIYFPAWLTSLLTRIVADVGV
ncbi:F(420)H(2) dehydrogenase subunit M [uncultured archaeon]|nr:F(420)H(2) dehydrogenase subunit M [uncultured archaeon]